jgi:hypothetical protein
MIPVLGISEFQIALERFSPPMRFGNDGSMVAVEGPLLIAGVLGWGRDTRWMA